MSRDIIHGFNITLKSGAIMKTSIRKTHANIWKKKPSNLSTFVSREIYLAFPFLKKKGYKRMLDIACGNGLGVSLPLARAGYAVYSFDKWKAAIQALEKNFQKEKFEPNTLLADMYKKFPFKSSFFDASFCFQALYHGNLSQIEHALKEIRRVTKEGGYFFGTFIPYIIRKEKNILFFDSATDQGGKERIHVQPDKLDPFLCYNLTKHCEYMVPHYYFTKKKLESVLKKHFKGIMIKKIIRKYNCVPVWFVCCQT
jgi:SAM-dependent methyltransferase